MAATTAPAGLFGAELRLSRERARLSLAALCERFRAHGRMVHRGYLANVERGQRLPSDRQFAELADVALSTDGLLGRLWDYADASRHVLNDQAQLCRDATGALAASALTPVVTGETILVPYVSAPGTVAYMRMSRRGFLATGGLATASLISGLFDRDELTRADSIADDILSGDPRRVMHEQTSHALDLTIAALIAGNGMRPTPLISWIREAPDPVLRVNAAGIAAKMSNSDSADAAVTALAADAALRQRYLTAVIARVLRAPWTEAERDAAQPQTGRHIPADSVATLHAELRNPNDAGARWCTAYLLADVWANPDHPGGPDAANALEAALADEPLPSLRSVYGRALARRALLN